MTTALIGQLDFHDLHVDASRIDQRSVLDGPAIGARLSELVAAFPRLLAVIAVGGARTANRHAPAAIAELADLSSMIADLAARAAGALVVITSRGGTSIDDDGSDFYGPGSSRHVPLMMVGPNVRAGVVSGEPGAPADIPATMLLGLGAATTSDLALGTWAAGAPLGGAPRPRPAHATEGRALVRAFRM